MFVSGAETICKCVCEGGGGGGGGRRHIAGRGTTGTFVKHAKCINRFRMCPQAIVRGLLDA